MRIRVKTTINEAQTVCRFLKSYSDFIQDGAWIVYETVLDDCYRLERRLRRINTLNGNKKISFTLDGLTVMDLHEGFFIPKDDRIRLCLTRNFDEANIYMIMWAVKEMLNNINRGGIKKSDKCMPSKTIIGAELRDCKDNINF